MLEVDGVNNSIGDDTFKVNSRIAFLVQLGDDWGSIDLLWVVTADDDRVF